MDIAQCKVESGNIRQVGEDGEECKSQAGLQDAKQRTVTIVKKSPSLSPPPALRSTITIRLWVSQDFFVFRVYIPYIHTEQWNYLYQV